MKEDPDIVKIFREEERLGKLTSQAHGSCEELETPGEVLEDMPNKSLTKFEEDAERRFKKDVDVFELENNK